MRLISLELTDYRGIAHETFRYPAGNCAVLFGMNGTGKTAVLDAVAAMFLPWVHLLFEVPDETEDPVAVQVDAADWHDRIIASTDVRSGTREAASAITVAFDSAGQYQQTWRATRTSGPAGQTHLEFDLAGMVARNFRGAVLDGIRTGTGQTNIPITVYYPTERTIIDVPLRIRKRHDFSHQLTALEGALQRRSQDFKVFFEWFRDREDLENERRLEGDPTHRDRELEAVRRALPAMLPDYGDLKVKRNPLRMEVRKEGEVLMVDQLSHGEKCVLALFADLARRLAIANPALADPLLGKGIVLIDEVELHLHPAWQRRIPGALLATFPNCQFLLSTHSPQVLAAIPNEQVFMLDRVSGQVKLIPGLPLYGRDSNQILEDVMGVPERPEGIQTQLRAAFDQLARANYGETHRLLDKLEEEIGADEPELVRLRTLLAAKEP